jgi:hypothetical protein
MVAADAQAAERGSGARGFSGHASPAHGIRHGGYRYGHGYWHGRHWYPSWGFYYGVPLFLSAAWGWPYYYDYYYYPRGGVIYRDVERYPQSYPEGVLVGPPVASTEVPLGDGAPTRGPLYMNYCESAKAYFPKVTTCPEGWRLATPAS